MWPRVVIPDHKRAHICRHTVTHSQVWPNTRFRRSHFSRLQPPCSTGEVSNSADHQSASPRPRLIPRISAWFPHGFRMDSAWIRGLSPPVAHYGLKCVYFLAVCEGAEQASNENQEMSKNAGQQVRKQGGCTRKRGKK